MVDSNNLRITQRGHTRAAEIHGGASYWKAQADCRIEQGLVKGGGAGLNALQALRPRILCAEIRQMRVRRDLEPAWKSLVGLRVCFKTAGALNQRSLLRKNLGLLDKKSFGSLAIHPMAAYPPSLKA
jgi:hypothetical protein